MGMGCFLFLRKNILPGNSHIWGRQDFIISQCSVRFSMRGYMREHRADVKLSKDTPTDRQFENFVITVIMTTFGATSDDKVLKLTGVYFQCHSLHSHTEMEMLSLWRNFRHWTKISSKWRHFSFSAGEPLDLFCEILGGNWLCCNS